MYPYVFVSAPGSYEMGLHKYSIIIIVERVRADWNRGLGGWCPPSQRTGSLFSLERVVTAIIRLIFPKDWVPDSCRKSCD